MKKRQIVIIEDEAPIRRGIADMLTAAGYHPIEAADGETGLVEARRFDVDVVLLDLLLPGMDGLEVLTRLRGTHPHLPVIILTARGSEDDRVRGLRNGADDYVVKPFSARELLARVEAVLRRSPGRPPAIKALRGPEATVDFQRREVQFADGERVALTEMEAGILTHLASNPGRAVAREELLTRVWGISAESLETRAIDMHITRLRAKLKRSDEATKRRSDEVTKRRSDEATKRRSDEVTKRRSDEATKRQSDEATQSRGIHAARQPSRSDGGQEEAQKPTGTGGDWIVTVRGQGYTLGPDVNPVT